VICFQFVLWHHICQRILLSEHHESSCDLLSIRSLTSYLPTRSIQGGSCSLLWFAFNSFFDIIFANYPPIVEEVVFVVICFQFVLWHHICQLLGKAHYLVSSCDLLSIRSLTSYLPTWNLAMVEDIRCDLLSIRSLTSYLPT